MPKKNNNILHGKTRKRQISLGSGWASNALKSLGYSAQDVISEMMPNTVSMISTTRETKEEIKDSFYDATKRSKELARSARTKLMELKDKDLMEAIEDIKSGKLYNKDRNSGDDFDLGGFGFDDSDFNFDEDFDSVDVSSSNPDTNVVVNVNIDEDNPMVEAQAITSATVAKGVEVIGRNNRSNSIAIASSISLMSTNITNNLQLIHSEVAKLSSTLPKSITEQAVLSAKFYEESIGYQKRIADSIDELKVMYTDSRKLASGGNGIQDKNGLDKFTGFNLDSYKDLIKSQGKNAILNNSIVSTAQMMFDMYKTNNELGESKGLAAQGLNAIVKGLMTKTIKNNAGKIDNFIESLFLPMGLKLGKWQDDWSNPLKRFIGNVFGINARPNLASDKSQYEKGAVAFDGKVHRAITDVIPTYLRMIASAVTGQEEVAFDYEKGVYNTVSNIRKDFKKNIRDAATSEYTNEKLDFSRIVNKLEGVGEEQKNYIKNTFNDFLYEMAKSGEFVSFRKQGDKDDIARLMGRTSNDPIVQLVRNYFEGLYDQGRHQELNEIFSRKTVSARSNMEKLYQKMTSDGTSGNYHLMDNGLDSTGKNAVKIGNGSVGLVNDKYGRNSTSYLRDILSTLATGIKVVNVGAVQGDASPIINHSKRILHSLNLDESEFRASQNSGSSSTSGPTTPVSYNLEQSLSAINSILEQTTNEDGALEWLIRKFGNNNVVGKAASVVKQKRDNINAVATQFVTKTTGKGIDMIYGKRPGDRLNEEDPDLVNVDNPPPMNDPRTTNIVVNDFRLKLKSFGTAFTTQVINPLTNALFDEDDGLITQIEETQIGENNSSVDDANKNLKNKIKNGTKNLTLGEQDQETGEYQNGLISGAANTAAIMKANVGTWSHELVYGSKDGSQVGILGHLRKIVGETEDGKLDVTGKLKSVGTDFKDHFKSRAYEWTDMLFGREGDEQSKLDVFLGDMKGKKGKIGASAVVGVLGSFFLPGGPIGGALIGASMGMVSQSTQMKNFLFGENDAEGNRTGGFITKEFQDFFKKKGKTLKVGAGVGLIGSMFLPGGPITGAIIGSGIALATKSEAFAKILYGEGGTKDDPTGGITKYIKEHYNKDKNVKSTFMDAGIGAGVGLIGSFFLPGGPITGALIGAGASIALNTDKFKNFFFGEEDPEDGKRKGGVFGKYKDKIVEKAEEAQDKLSLWIQENITNPVAASIEPLKEKAKRFLFGSEDEDGKKGLMGAIADRVNNSAFGDLKRAVKENIIDKMKDGFNKIFGGFFKLVGSIIKSPITALQAIAENVNTEINGENAPTLAERIKERNAKSREKMAEKKAAREEQRRYNRWWNSKKKNDGNSDNTDNSKSQENQKDVQTPEGSDAKKLEPTENIAKVATSTEKVANVVQEQLSNSKEHHTETVSILKRILDVLPKRNGKKGAKRRKGQLGTVPEFVEDDDTPTVATGSSLVGTNPIDRISSNVEKIAKSVDGQLNGAGYNIHRIYKLLRKKLKKSGDDDDDGDGYDDVKHKKYRGIRGRFNQIKDFLKKPGEFIVGIFKNVKDSIVEGFKNIFGGIFKVGKTILGLPKRLIEGVAKAVPTILKGIGGAFKFGLDLLGSGIRSLANVIEEGSKGFGNMIAGALSGFGSLMHGLGIFGKETLSLLAKGGAKAITGVAKAGSFIASTAISAVSGLFKKKNKNGIQSKITIDGGHLDYVTIVKKIGGKGVESSNEGDPTPSNVVLFPGTSPDESASSINGSFMMAGLSGFGSNMKDRLRTFGNRVKDKKDNLVARVKGSAENIRNKFKREDAEEEQRTWREKILKLLHKNTNDNEEHHSVWKSIFSKKGIITMGLIAFSPLIIKLVKGVLGFVGSDLWNSIGTAISRLGDAIDGIGGLPGLVNNVGEEVKAITDLLGLREREEIKIDPETGTPVLDENGNIVYESMGKESLSKRIKEFFLPTETKVDHETGELYQESMYNHKTQTRANMVATAIHLGSRRVKKGLDAAKEVMNSKLGQSVVKGAKNVGKTAGKHIVKGAKTAGKHAVKGAASVANKSKVSTIIDFCKGAVKFLTDKMGTVLKKFGCEGKAGTLTKKVGEITKKLIDGETISKFIGKFAKPLAKVAAAAGTLLVSDAVWAVTGAISGAANAGELFQVNPEDVDGKMRAISAVFKGVLNTSWCGWLDVIDDICYELFGYSFISELATLVYHIISPEEDDAKIDQLRAKFDQEYKDYVTEEYNAYLKNMEQSGKGDQAMSEDEFKASELATTKADYNAMKNPSLGKKLWDGAKSLGKGFVSGAKSLGKGIKNTFAKHEETGWFDANGSYYVKFNNSYNHYNPNGDLISTVGVDEVDQMIESGMLTKKGVTVKSNLGTTVDMAVTGIGNLWNSAKQKASEFRDKWSKRISDFGKKISDNPIAKYLLPHKKTVLTTANGSYYMEGSNGTYDYYNAHGVMIASSIPSDEVTAMLEAGQLTESEKWVTGRGERFSKLQQLGHTVFSGFKDLVAKGGEVWDKFKEKVSEHADYWRNNIKEHGVFGAVKNAFAKKKKKAWYDVKGGYYVENSSGNYDYYNANGDLVSEDVDKDEVQDMLLQGLLTEGEIVTDSDAQNAIKGIKNKLSELWNKAKDTGSNALDNIKKWLGLADESEYVGTTTASSIATSAVNAAKGGKGGDDHTVSSSGTVNGFAYYSQNDPSIKDKSYNLSDGTRDTMGERGCGPAAMSMVTSQLTGRKVDPVAMANLATSKGYSIESGTTPGYFQDAASTVGIDSANIALNKESIRQSLSDGNPLILQGVGNNPNSPFTSEGHYVVGVGLNGDNIIVNDPRGRQYSGEYNLNDMLSGVQNAWAFSNNSIADSRIGYTPGISGGSSIDKVGSPMMTALMGGALPGGVSTTSKAPSNAYSVSTHPNAFNAAGMYNVSDLMKWDINNKTNGTTNIPDKLRAQVVAAMKSIEGVNTYDKDRRDQVESGYGDCSSTVRWALQTGANIDPGSYSEAQYTSGIGVDVDNTIGGPDESKLKPGDLLFYNRGKSNRTDGVGHVEMYIGDGNRMGHGKDKGPVVTALSKDGGNYLKARRFINDGAADYNSPTLSAASSSFSGSSAYSDNYLSSSQISDGIESTEENSKKNKSVLEILLGAASALIKPITDWMTGGSSSNSSGNITNGGASASIAGGINGGITSGTITPTEEKQQIWDYFISKGMTKEGVSGLMGNLEHESGNRPVRVQGDLTPPYVKSQEFTKQVDNGTKDFINGFGGGYGLAQWTSKGRKEGLLNAARSKGKSIGDLGVQLDYLNHELNTGYKGVLNVLNTTNDIKTASDAVLHDFERPKDQSSAVENKRASSAMAIYNQYANGQSGYVSGWAPYKVNPNLPTPNSELFGNTLPNSTLTTEQGGGHHVSSSGSSHGGGSASRTDRGGGAASRTDRNGGGASRTNAGSIVAASAVNGIKGGKGGKGGSPIEKPFTIVDSKSTYNLTDTTMNYSKYKNNVAMIDNPLFAKMVELLGYVVENTSGINQGVKDLFGKEISVPPTQILTGETHNNLIPVPQKSEEKSKDTHQYNTAKRISAGIYVS